MSKYFHHYQPSPRRERAEIKSRCYGSNAFASATASVKACCAGTLLNRASWTCLSKTALTSALCGIVGTMSAYLEMASLANGLALSSIATGGVEKNGSAYESGVGGYI